MNHEITSNARQSQSPACSISRAQAEAIDRDGFFLVENWLPLEQVQRLREMIDSLDGEQTIQTRTGASYAARNLLDRLPGLWCLVESGAMRGLVEPILGPGAFVVRSILFDKTESSNWPVGWHQDTTIAVRSREDVPGFGPWSVKDGVIHVRPPAEVLERMLTVRVHLDDTFADNAALRVLPGSHARGLQTDAEIAEHRSCAAEHVCETTAGGLLLMRPLILHASHRAARPSRRRVLHFEFVSEGLPPPLAWAASDTTPESAGQSPPAVSSARPR
jgi:Phytanoyl-CoA dioxygenase (PhyH)